MLAAQEARHGGGSKRSGRSEGRARHLGFVTQAIGHDFGFGICFCHKRILTQSAPLT
jgi:hypothetical protein